REGGGLSATGSLQDLTSLLFASLSLLALFGLLTRTQFSLTSAPSHSLLSPLPSPRYSQPLLAPPLAPHSRLNRRESRGSILPFDPNFGTPLSRQWHRFVAPSHESKRKHFAFKSHF